MRGAYFVYYQERQQKSVIHSSFAPLICVAEGRTELTDFYELVVCVTPEKAVREERDDRVDGRHVQDADTTR